MSHSSHSTLSASASAGSRNLWLKGKLLQTDPAEPAVQPDCCLFLSCSLSASSPMYVNLSLFAPALVLQLIS